MGSGWVTCPQCKLGLRSPMLGLPPRRDVVSRLTHYVEGSFEHLYWGSMMRHVPGLKQLCKSTSVDLSLDFSPLGGILLSCKYFSL